MRALDEGQSFIVTRHSQPVGELRPMRRQRLVDAHAVTEVFRNAPPLDHEKFQADLDEAINADIVVLATTASEPYINRRFRPGQLVLNISLRDIGPDSILAASNIVDDVDHCLRERTSLHLTEQAAGNRNFIMGTLAQVLRGEIAVPHDRPIVFSPFGLGILDLVVATRIFAQALEAGETIEIPDFYAGAGHRREMTA